MSERPVPIQYDEPARLRRIRRFAQLLDRSIVLPGGFRIGIDPIIGLIPGFGDLIGTALSLYIVYEAARLGISKRILLRMSANVCIEMLVGEIPILGDIFDAVWKANVRNARLVEMNYRPRQRERSAGKIFWAMAILFMAILTLGLIAFGGILWLISSFVNAL